MKKLLLKTLLGVMSVVFANTALALEIYVNDAIGVNDYAVGRGETDAESVLRADAQRELRLLRSAAARAAGLDEAMAEKMIGDLELIDTVLGMAGGPSVGWSGRRQMPVDF